MDHPSAPSGEVPWTCMQGSACHSSTWPLDILWSEKHTQRSTSRLCMGARRALLYLYISTNGIVVPVSRLLRGMMRGCIGTLWGLQTCRKPVCTLGWPPITVSVGHVSFPGASSVVPQRRVLVSLVVWRCHVTVLFFHQTSPQPAND